MKKGILLLSVIVIIALGVTIPLYFILHVHLPEQSQEQALDDSRGVGFIAENLAERIAELSGREDFASDYSIPLLNNGTISFHVHAMQKGQFCPLHIHRSSEEAVLIVQGEARVMNVVSKREDGDGTKEVKETILPRNTLFFAPPGSAHEFTNISDEVLACLVIHTPPFQGNLYVKEESVVASADISVQSLSRIADSMVGAGPDEMAIAKVNCLHNVECLLMRTASPLDQNMAKGYDLVLVYFNGEALLEILDRKIKLMPTFFVGIPAGTPFRIVPSAQSQDSHILCFYLIPEATVIGSPT